MCIFGNSLQPLLSRCYSRKTKSKVKRRKVEAGGIFYEKVSILVSKMSASKARGKNWSHLEDEALCRAWLDVILRNSPDL